MSEVSFDLEMIYKTIDNTAILNELINPPDKRKTIQTSLMQVGSEQEPGQNGMGVGEKEYKTIGLYIMRTIFHDQLNLTIKMKELRVFQNVLQLILYHNNRII